MADAKTYNTQAIKVERKWYVGTTAIRKGQVLCYDNTIANTLLPDDGTYYDPTMPIMGPAAAQISRKAALGNSVTYPSASNSGKFCGIAADSAIGKVGPIEIDVMIPKAGDLIKLECWGAGSTYFRVDDAAEVDFTNNAFKYLATIVVTTMGRAVCVFKGKATRSDTYTTAALALAWFEFVVP